MGMAASQARLLMITARMHDIEYQAQTIQNAKVQLATQSDQVYQKYLEALEATTLTRTNMEGKPITANFNNISGLGSINFNSGLNNKYAITDNRTGYLVVDEDVKNAYDNFEGNDPYQFALFAMDMNDVDYRSLEECEEAVYDRHKDEKSGNCKEMANLKESMNAILAENGVEDYNDLPEEAMDKYDDLEEVWRYKLYKQFAAEIYAENIGGGEEDIDLFDNETFKYYASVYKQIEFAGGCISINEFNGVNNGDAENDSDWLKTMLQSGKFSMFMVNEDSKNGEVTLAGSSPSSDSEIGYTTTSTIDKAALAKAEAEYEHETKKIDQKDKKFDMDLSKLDTERSALKTQYDAIKNVVKDNVERTFGIFS